MKKISILLSMTTLFQNVAAAEQIDVEVLLGRESEQLQAHNRTLGYEEAVKEGGDAADALPKLKDEIMEIQAQITKMDAAATHHSNMALIGKDALAKQHQLLTVAKMQVVANGDLGFSIDIYMRNLQAYLDDNQPDSYDRFVNQLVSETGIDKRDLLTKKSLNTVEEVKSLYTIYGKYTSVEDEELIAISALAQRSQLQARLGELIEKKNSLEKTLPSYEGFFK